MHQKGQAWQIPILRRQERSSLFSLLNTYKNINNKMGACLYFPTCSTFTGTPTIQQSFGQLLLTMEHALWSSSFWSEIEWWKQSRESMAGQPAGGNTGKGSEWLLSRDMSSPSSLSSSGSFTGTDWTSVWCKLQKNNACKIRVASQRRQKSSVLICWRIFKTELCFLFFYLVIEFGAAL